MKFKKQIVIAIFVSLLLTSCSLNLKAGIIKHEDKNKSVEEVIKKAEESIKKAEEILRKEERVSEDEKKELVVKVKNEFEDLISSLSETTDEIKIKELLKDKFENCTSFIIRNIYFATEEEEFYLVPEQDIPEGFNPTNRSWYTQAKEYGEASASFLDAVNNSETLGVSFVVKSDEVVVGVLGVDIDLANYLDEEKEKIANEIKNEINDILLELSEILDEEKIKELLKEEFDNSNLDIANIYFATEKGEFYTYPEWDPPEEYNPTERVWYTETKEEGEYTTSYHDDLINQDVLTLAFSVKSGESFIGVLGVDINLENNR